MFGLFKKPTPEEKLTEELAGAIQSTVELALREFPLPETQGMYVRLAIDTCRQTALDRSNYLANKYGLTVYEVYGVITKCHFKALEYFLQ
ncbi:hypothetical protein [Flavobacterium lindanitolerans]|jgi:hypothetical protein|uniref:hypothetical protein n=1 Tax=Flavobacterium lindanitolerans TaxID=428988 RepID=UPI0023F4DB73|nr:hypothetical protein [Flavobacterium lindanitolerans]